jgi:branched-chain amino acid transport system ATP-binding protein
MAAALLEVRNLDAGYGRVGVLDGISLAARAGQIVAVLGSNGAGKSTLLKTISGLLVPSRGEILFDGRPIAGLPPDRIVARGLLHVAEGRRLFRTQSVADNLELGLYRAGLSRGEERQRYEAVYALFPILRERRHLAAGLLSGGQQQMLAIGQALMRSPRLLMLDEVSLGLAPAIVDQVLEVVQRLRAEGCTIILVEQLVERALEIADYGYVLQNGRVGGAGTAAELAASDIVRRAYLGTG